MEKVLDNKRSSLLVPILTIGVSAGMVLGVPVTSLIAGHRSFSVAMLFFAIVNAAGRNHSCTRHPCRYCQQQLPIYDYTSRSEGSRFCERTLPYINQPRHSRRNRLLRDVYHAVRYPLCRYRSIYLPRSGYRIHISQTVECP